MLTIFSTPKPFRGHIDIIQRNAIKSWTLLHPDTEIILIGDDDGTAEVCEELEVRHEPNVQRHDNGPPRLDHVFDRAQEVAKHPILCYVNCDIMLTSQFLAALQQVTSTHRRFLMSGRRWDTDITEPWNFAQPDWEDRLCALAHRQDNLQPPFAVDYFAFPRGMYSGIPAMRIARFYWDPWLIWKAKSVGAAVIDATEVVTAVHQNHDYSYNTEGAKELWRLEETKQNFRLSGGRWHLNTLDDATHKLTPSGQKYRWTNSLSPLKRNLWSPVWVSLLDVTRPVRQVLGLRRGMLLKTRK